MALLVSVFAAVICTAIWYARLPKNDMKLGLLCSLYWGASLMWFVDAVVEYAEIGSAYFEPEASALLNDLFLGLSVVALGLVIWTVVLLITDPRKVLSSALFKKEEK